MLPSCPDVRALVMMVLSDGSVLTPSRRTLLLKPEDDTWKFCQSFGTETAGLRLYYFLSDYVHGR